MHYIIGIDPGAKGAAVVLDKKGRFILQLQFNKLTLHEIAVGLRNFKKQIKKSKKKSTCCALMEKVHSIQPAGKVANFGFGRNQGLIEGILVALKIPYDFVTPVKWQSAMKCRSKGDKRVTRAKAQQLYPNQKITHTTADAFLIARYGCDSRPTF